MLDNADTTKTANIDSPQAPQKHLPAPGDVVNYVLPDGPNKGAIRGAIVSRVWGSGPGWPAINLWVFGDGINDGPYDKPLWVTSVLHSDDHGEPRTWHFKPPVGAQPANS